MEDICYDTTQGIVRDLFICAFLSYGMIVDVYFI
jgi:hypothetical protein